MRHARPKVSDSRFVRFLVARRRLLVTVLLGVALLFVLPDSLRPATRYLVAWDATSALYVGLAFWMIARSSHETCQLRAALYDESDWVIIVLVVSAAAASFVAIFTELTALKDAVPTPWRHLVAAGVTVVLSWTFTHVIFTLHYANLYYLMDSEGRHCEGLKFPGSRAPDYRDFLYYSFVIGCAAQTGDVQTVSPAMRMVSLAHGIVAFVFNTTILALTINVGASLVL